MDSPALGGTGIVVNNWYDAFAGTGSRVIAQATPKAATARDDVITRCMLSSPRISEVTEARLNRACGVHVD